MVGVPAAAKPGLRPGVDGTPDVPISGLAARMRSRAMAARPIGSSRPAGRQDTAAS